jgi:chromosome segregation ATPase
VWNVGYKKDKIGIKPTMSVSPSLPSNPSPLKELNTGLQESTQLVTQLTTDVSQIETTLNDTIQHILDSFQEESSQRRKMVEAFKSITDMLKQCKESQPSSPALQQLDSRSAQLTTLVKEHDQSTQTLTEHVERLTRELAAAKEQISILQQQVNQAATRRDTLHGENTQLKKSNNKWEYLSG